MVPEKAWLRARARLTPGAWTPRTALQGRKAAPWVRGVLDGGWAPMVALEERISPLPPWVWEFLLGQAGGFVAIIAGDCRSIPTTEGTVVPWLTRQGRQSGPKGGRARDCRSIPSGAREGSSYQPGPATLRGQAVENVAFVSVQDLSLNNERPLHVIGHLIDHHLGCGGDAQGPWLSEGGGGIPLWQEAGARLGSLFALGYGIDEVARSNVRDYLAQSLALYCRDRQRLSVADPQVTKWLRSTLWNDAFWRAG